MNTNTTLLYIAIAFAAIAGPIFLPAYTQQFAVLWVMILMASTWDILGGQMGYNSLGNITFFWCRNVYFRDHPDSHVL